MKREWVAIFEGVCNAKRMRALPDNTCRLLYLLLQTKCDSWGRVGDDAQSLWAACWATFGSDCSIEETERALGELERVGLIERRNSEVATWIQIPDWEEKAGAVGERKKRGRSKFPDPTRDSLATDSEDTRDSVENESSTEQSRAEQSREHAARVPRTRAREASPEKGPDPRAVALGEHEGFGGAELWDALGRWEKHQRERGESWTLSTWRSNVKRWASWGPATTVLAIDTAIGAGKGTPFVPKHAEHRPHVNGSAKTPEQRRAEEARLEDERRVERLWAERHRTLIDVDGPGGTKIRAPGTDGPYPGYELAKREVDGEAPP